MVDHLTDEYKINKGITESQVEQLIKFAATDEGLKYTSDPKRFKNRESFDEFSKEILAFYTLVDSEENLMGIIWFHDLDLYLNERNYSSSKKKSSDYGISFAIRLYGEARGKGFALPFTEKVMADFENSDEYKNHPHKKIWLSVSPENEPAINLYRKLGFKDLKIEETNNKLLMLLKD